MERCRAPLRRGKTCIGLTKGKPKKFTQDTPDEKVVAFVPWILGEFLFCSGVSFHHVPFSFNPSLVSFFFFFSFISHPSSASYQAFKEGGARVYSITEQGWPGRVIGSV